MAHSQWCGNKCSECSNPCRLDSKMFCSPDCEAINPKTNLADRDICLSCRADLVEVSQEEMSDIIESRIPTGSFYLKDGDIWIGVDNETGDAWTEEFNHSKDCFKWLYGIE